MVVARGEVEEAEEGVGVVGSLLVVVATATGRRVVQGG